MCYEFTGISALIVATYYILQRYYKLGCNTARPSPHCKTESLQEHELDQSLIHNTDIFQEKNILA